MRELFSPREIGVVGIQSQNRRNSYNRKRDLLPNTREKEQIDENGVKPVDFKTGIYDGL